MRTIQHFLGLFFILFLTVNLVAQDLTNNDYTKALWMTTRMYGGQRSGDGPNWLIMDHTPSSADMSLLQSSKGADLSKLQAGKCFTDDADGVNSLEGGWVDCGDHVKFGQTYFYAAYTLLKAYAEFPEGFDDFYSFDYSGYQSTGNFSWEGGDGEANGIPDILDELKYQTDFLIQCAPNSTTFYSQVGDGDADHKNWVTSVAMATLPKSEGGQADGPRNFVKNPNDASMPSNCAATLALMSRMYEPFDPVYAATCLTHAEYAYQYAKSKQGGTISAGQFYLANARWEDDYISACAELYWATENESYKTEAIGLKGSIDNHNYVYCYNNNDDVAAYNLALLGDTYGETLLEEFALMYKAAVSDEGLYTGGDATWGPLRYNANAAFIVGLWQKYNNATSVDQFIYDQIDYILGSNSADFSFVVGFNRAGCGSCNSAQHPHHRNVFLSDDIMANQDNLVIPTRNAQHGYMIGGSRNPSFTEDIGDYQTSEGGIDYNAGLVASLGYIISMNNPVDINKFGHPTPELGNELTLCGTGEATITATVDLSSLQPGESITYKWYKGSSTTPFNEGTNLTSVTVTQADTYRCEIVETSGSWITSDDVVVSAELPTVDLGANAELCEASTKILDAGVSGTGINYAWSIGGSVISQATSQTYTAYNAGTYSVTVSAAGCTSKSDNITITSLLPEVQHDTICTAGTINLAVLTPGTYTWYDAETNGSILGTETTYSTSISESTTFYVQDANSFIGSVGPTSIVGAGTNWGISATNHLNFTAASDFTILSLKVSYGTIYNNISNGTISIEILDGSGNPFTPAKIFTSDEMNITTAMSGSLVQFTFTDFNISKDWGTDLRMRMSDQSINGALEFNTSGASYPYESSPAGIVSITGKSGGGDASAYMYFYDWEIMAGSSCARTPVLAVIDPNADCGDTQVPTAPGTISFSNITLDSFSISWGASSDNTGVTEYEIYLDGALYETASGTTTSTTISNLDCNTDYTVKIRAKDAAGNISDFNTEATTTTNNVETPIITNSTPEICEGDEIILSIPSSSGATYSWSGPNSYSATTNSISRTNATTNMGGTYSVTLTIDGCASNAASSTVTINTIPDAPMVSSPVEYNVGETASPLSATGSNLLWYTSPTGLGSSTAPTPSATSEGTTPYYVTQSINTCESPQAQIDVIVTSNSITQDITLTSGWNLISFYTLPSDASIESVFGTALSSISIIKNSDGFYKPEYISELQSLQNISLGEAYLVFAESTVTISVSGDIPTNTNVSLTQGWNFMGYPQASEGDLQTVLSPIWSNTQTIKNFDAFKDQTSGTLQILSPGEGYFIYMNVAENIDL
ncbi:MAG: glycoside hydrolase family 9 protein [Bacteroidales bacterium]|jgi:hypothetical protein|nr:glycoside hydrolase family 9 protein [Bacteroidales bacterium]